MSLAPTPTSPTPTPASNPTPTPAPDAATAAAGPQSTSGAAPSSVPGAEAAAAEVDWASYVEGAEPPAEPVAPAPVADPQPSVAASAPATATPPDPQAAPQPPVDPAAGKADPQSPEAAARARVEAQIAEINSPEWQQARLTQLEQGYQLSEEEAEALETDPKGALPKLAAKMHLKMMFQAHQMMATMVEQMLIPQIQHQVGAHHAQVQASEAARRQIFGPYPELEKASAEVVSGAMAMAKASLPATATSEQKLAKVASLVYATYGWQMPQAGKAAPLPAPAKSLPPLAPPSGGAAVSVQPTKAAPEANGIDWGEYINA